MVAAATNAGLSFRQRIIVVLDGVEGDWLLASSPRTSVTVPRWRGAYRPARVRQRCRSRMMRAPCESGAGAEYLLSMLTAGSSESNAPATGLPVATLLEPVPDSSLYFVVTVVDHRGRAADGSPVRVLGWARRARLRSGSSVVLSSS
ncbi:hypothetical protein [Amycolatopsis ultiminotia]|uniref:hypothetical protein n=1 Tax=Amycolatopsis ultiminotia TaxID=543629 RepID=UPI0031EDC0F2